MPTVRPNRWIVALSLFVVLSTIGEESVKAQFRPGGAPAGPSTPSPGGGRSFAPSRNSPNQPARPGNSFRNPPANSFPNSPGVPPSGSFNPNSGVPSQGQFGSNAMGGPNFNPGLPRQNMGVSNPWRRAPGNIHNAPGGIQPQSSAFFPRPAVPVPSRINNAFMSPALGGNPATQFKQFSTAQNAEQLRTMADQQLQGQRSLENYLGVIGALNNNNLDPTLVQQYRREALGIARQQVAARPQSVMPYAALAKLSLESGNVSEFRDSTKALLQQFPNDMHAHYFNGIDQLQQHRYAEAQQALQKAKELGIPAESINEYLKLAIDGQRWIWEYAQIVMIVIALWCAGLAALYILGKSLSAITKRKATSPSRLQSDTFSDRLVRRIYRWVIGLAGVYYYLSLPILVLAAIALPLTIGYALLSLPSISLLLIVVVLLAGCTGISTAISGVRAAIFRLRTPEVLGVEVTRQDAPQLWALLEAIASQLETRSINKVRMTPGTDLAVTEEGSLWSRWRNRSQRVLIIGAAVLEDFDQNAFRCVIGHEYGHFSNRDTAGGDVSLRVWRSMDAFAQRIEDRGKIRWWDIAIHFLRFYHYLFRNVSFGASRLQEVLADRLAVSKYGSAALREGLLHAIRRNLEFDVQFGKVLNERISNPGAQASFYGTNYRFDTDLQDQIDMVIHQIVSAPSTDEDTHPSAGERFALAKFVESQKCERLSGGVWDLFSSREEMQNRLATQLNDVLNREAQHSRKYGSLLLSHLNQVLNQTRNPNALFDRAYIYNKLGQFEDAKADLLLLLKDFPNATEVHFELALVEERLKAPSSAIGYMKSVARLDPAAKDDFDFLHRLARLYLEAGSPALAISTANRLIELDANRVNPWLIRGKSHLHLQQTDKAESDLRHVLSLMPTCEDAIAHLANLAPTNSPTQAIPILNAADRFDSRTGIAKSFDKDKLEQVDAGRIEKKSEKASRRPQILLAIAASVIFLTVSGLAAASWYGHGQWKAEMVRQEENAMREELAARQAEERAQQQMIEQKLAADKQKQQELEELQAQRRAVEEANKARELEAQRLRRNEQVEENLVRIAQGLESGKEADGDTALIGPANAENPQLSWRVYALPALGQLKLYNQFHLDEPWDSPHNIQLAKATPDIFKLADEDQGTTCIRSPLKLDGPIAERHVYSDLQDGADQTALLFCVDAQYSIPWSKPDSSQPLPEQASLVDLSRPGVGLQMICVDRSRYFGQQLKSVDSDEELAAVRSLNGGEFLVVHQRGGRQLFTSQPAGSHQPDENVAKLERVASAIEKYKQTIRRGGADNSPLSWRVALLPYLGYQELYDKFHKLSPWNDSHNLSLLDQMPVEFQFSASRMRTTLRNMSAGNALEQFSEHRTDLDPPGETIFAVLCNQRSNSIWTCPDDFEFAGEMKSRLPSQAEEVLAINGIPAVVKLPSQLHNSKWEALFSIAGRDFLDLEKCLERPSDLIARKLPVSKAGEIANVLALPKLPAKSNEPAKAKHSLSENQRLLANAFHQYDQTYRRLPNSLQSDSKPSGLSWRVHLLPFIEQQALYDKFDLNKPWDSSPNLELISLMPSIYKTANVQGDHSPYRMIANERSRRVTDYQRTIMFVECNTTSSDPWTKPDDIVVDENTSVANLTSHSALPMVMWDLAHFELPSHFPPKIVQTLMQGAPDVLLDVNTLCRHIAQFTNTRFIGSKLNEQHQFELTQMKQIAHGWHNFESQFKCFPPKKHGGRNPELAFSEENLSWRVHILPTIGHDYLYRQFRLNEPWDSPHNIQLLHFMPDLYRDAQASADSTTTRILSIIGEGAMLRSPAQELRPSRDFIDGSNRTIMFLQTPPDINVPWTKPIDIPLDRLDTLDRRNGLKIAMVSGAVIQLQPNIDGTTLRALATVAGKELVPDASWRSE